MENDKIKVVKEWKTSTKIKEVESFLEFANLYWHFIKNFSYMTKSLNKLKNGNKKKNIRRHSKNLKTKSQVNQYLFYWREKENWG